MIAEQAKVVLCTLTRPNILGDGIKANKMALGSLFFLMETSMKGHGRMARCMEMVHTFLTALEWKVNGNMAI